LRGKGGHILIIHDNRPGPALALPPVGGRRVKAIAER